MYRRLAFLSLTLTLFVCAPARGQAPDTAQQYVRLPLNVSLVPGISIGDAVASATGARVVDQVAFMLAGRSARLEGVACASLWSAYDEAVRGTQFSGVVNTAGGRVRGAQFAGVANVSRGADGVQSAGVANVAQGPVYGAQFAGVVNLAAGSVRGAQFAGVANTAAGRADAQFAGVANVSHGVDGVQAAGVASVAQGPVEGVQLAGVVNLARGPVRGGQVAGVVNVAPAVTGVQLGIVNVADEHTGVPIGLVSYVRSVGLRYDVWADETGMVTGAVRSGNRRFANYLGVAVPAGSGDARAAAVAGLGAEFPVAGGVFGGLDVLSYGVFGDAWKETGSLSKVRLVGGVALGGHLALYAGPTFSVYVTDDRDGLDVAPWDVYDARVGGARVQLWPGFTAGVRLAPRGL